MTTLNETVAAMQPKQLLATFNALAATIPGMAPCARFSSRNYGVARTQKLLEVVLEREHKDDVDAEFAGRAAAIVEGREFVPANRRNGDRPVTATEEKLDAAVPVVAKLARKDSALDAEGKVRHERKPRTSGRIILKANKEVRAQLTAAAKRLGATRLAPIGFTDYSAFLNGFEPRESVVFTPVGGTVKADATVFERGEVKLTIDDGKFIVEAYREGALIIE